MVLMKNILREARAYTVQEDVLEQPMQLVEYLTTPFLIQHATNVISQYIDHQQDYGGGHFSSATKSVRTRPTPLVNLYRDHRDLILRISV